MLTIDIRLVIKEEEKLKKPIGRILVYLVAFITVLVSCSLVSCGKEGTTTTEVAQATGKPQYGGTITVALSGHTPNFDTVDFRGAQNDYMYEGLFKINTAIDPKEWNFGMSFVPDQYLKGNLVETWDMPDSTTIILHVRQGVLWPNKAPVNGREFTAYDIQEHFDRVMGKGSYTEPAAMLAQYSSFFASFTATDKYTVEVKLVQPNAMAFNTLYGGNTFGWIEAPESVKEGGGKITDWTKAIGTGPWILTDYKSDTSLTYSKNPTYWGKDDQYPENQLPYAEQLKFLIMPDIALRTAALRSGQIDMLACGARDYLNVGSAIEIQQTNPELITWEYDNGGSGIELRCDKAPFNDIRIRKALQSALDLPTIAKTYYYGKIDPTPAGYNNRGYKGWAYLYEDWPQSLKDEYTYNVDEANKLLKEAGYPNGFSMNLVISNDQDNQFYQLIQSYLSKINVTTEYKTVDNFPAMQAYLGSGADYDASAAGVATQMDPPTVLRERITGGATNYVFCNSSEMDALYQKYLNAATQTEAANIVMQADKLCIEQHWAVTTFGLKVFNFSQPYIGGYSGGALSFGSTQLCFAKMWMDKDMKATMGR